jgi:hypothetical protein
VFKEADILLQRTYHLSVLDIMPNLPTWFFDPENVLSTSRYSMSKTASKRNLTEFLSAVGTRKVLSERQYSTAACYLCCHTSQVCFLETTQLLLISCGCGCSVKGLPGCLIAARERPLRWARGRMGGGRRCRLRYANSSR